MTGATGFIGRQALSALGSTGYEVHAVSRRSRVDDDVVWHRADLLQDNDLRDLLLDIRPKVVLHLAWCVEHGTFWTSHDNLDWAAATLRMVRAARDAGVRRFIGAGTCYEYDWPDKSPCAEDITPITNHTIYDAAKDGVRRTLEAFCRQCEMEFAWARVFFAYGAYEPPNRLVASVARALLAGKPAKCSSGMAVRDFMDVRDVGAAISAVSVSNAQGAVNIGSGEGISIRQVALKLGELSGRPELIRIGARPDRADEPPYIVADATKLVSSIGFSPRYNLSRGLTEALHFWDGQLK